MPHWILLWGRGYHKSSVRASCADAMVWWYLKVDSSCLHTLRAEIALSLVFTWPKAFNTKLTFRGKTGDSLKADPATKPPLSRLYTSWKLPISKIGPDALRRKTFYSLVALAFTIWNWGTHKQHQGECSSSEHGKSFAVGQQAQDTGETFPQARECVTPVTCFTPCRANKTLPKTFGNPSSAPMSALAAGVRYSIVPQAGNTSERWRWWCFLFLLREDTLVFKSLYQQESILNSTVLSQPHNALRQTGAFPA